MAWSYRTSDARRSFLWLDGRVHDLGALRPISGTWSESEAKAINERGQVVGWSGSPPHAFLWQRGTMRDLGVLSGHSGSLAWAINDQGLVVGYSVASLPTKPQSSDCYHAAVWKSGKITDLGVLSGAKKCNSLALERGWQSSAQAINNRDTIVGASEGHAVLWTLETGT